MDKKEMKRADAEKLLERYLVGKVTPLEKDSVERFYIQYLQELSETAANQNLKQDLQGARIRDEMWSHIHRELHDRPVHHTIVPATSRVWHRIAASFLLFVGISAMLYYFLENRGIFDGYTDRDQVAHSATPITPGTNRATLRLPNGQIIDLKDQKSGIMINLTDAMLQYEDGSSVLDHVSLNRILSSKDPSELQLVTPKGGMYSLTLSDGTKVWLNAESKLKYPLRFDQPERVVELEGEAFFEVKPQSENGRRKPFKVRSAGQLVEVLGTAFNVTSYPDDPFSRTTLVEGKVRIHHLDSADTKYSGETADLVAGQQAILTNGVLELRSVDAHLYTAWKEGKFRFEAEPIQQVMQQLARWYNVQIQYQGRLPTHRFTGAIDRSENIEGVLRKLAATEQARFTIEGRNIMVSR